MEDNGVGRKKHNGDAEKEDNGYGMQMRSDRIRLFNNEKIASVQITDLFLDEKPAGTRELGDVQRSHHCSRKAR